MLIPRPPLEAWCARLIALGYARATIQAKMGVASELTRWLVDAKLTIVDLGEQRIEAFLMRCRRRHNRGVRVTLLQLIEQLRAAGVVSRRRAIRLEWCGGHVRGKGRVGC